MAAGITRIAFLFVDGLGITADDRSPLRSMALPTLQGLTGDFSATAVERDGAAYRVLDATLGISGLPQSATGQTALLTGMNAAEVLGRHQGPHPGSRLQALLASESIHVWATRRGLRVFHGNAYRREYLQRVLGARRNMLSAFAFAARAVGASLLDIDDPRAHMPGYWRDAHAAGRAFAAAADAHDLTILEYWALDYSGHRERESVPTRLAELDEFVRGFVERGSDATLVITSDHGNAEESWHHQHTRNPVPLIVLGPAAGTMPASMTSLIDVGGWLKSLFADQG